VFVIVERNQTKYFVSQIRKLLNTSCVSRASDVSEARCGHPWLMEADMGYMSMKDVFVHDKMVDIMQ
jgi:hypothetical protein